MNSVWSEASRNALTERQNMISIDVYIFEKRNICLWSIYKEKKYKKSPYE
jgi:hypothetical protein